MLSVGILFESNHCYLTACFRLVRTEEEQFFCLWREGRCLKELILVGTLSYSFFLYIENTLKVFTYAVFFLTVHHFGRAVIMFGVPYVYTQSRILKVHKTIFVRHSVLKYMNCVIEIF